MPFFRPLTPPAPMLTEATVTLFRLFIGGKKVTTNSASPGDHRCNGHVPGRRSNKRDCSLAQAWLMAE